MQQSKIFFATKPYALWRPRTAFPSLFNLSPHARDEVLVERTPFGYVIAELSLGSRFPSKQLWIVFKKALQLERLLRFLFYRATAKGLKCSSILEVPQMP